MTWAWNPSRVTSADRTAVGSSIPWPRMVRISGYWAARPGSIISTLTMRKWARLPSGLGSGRMVWLAAARL